MQPGTVIAGKFRVDRLLGQGGMGEVVVATHLQLDQTVALKFLHAEIVWQPEIMERLMREARASAKLKSDHVCRVMDVGLLDSGAPYIVMELLDGEDLSHRIRRAPLTPAVAAAFVLQACVAIAEAHAADIVHRDLKPSNLFVTERLDGTPLIKVLDFGIAKSPSKSEVQITRTTAVMGSPGYMSPEQLRSSKSVDGRTDLWSLGVILFEAVAGYLPFRADTITELAVKISVDPPEQLPPGIDPAYAAIVARCLEKTVDRRYQTVAELARDLAPIAGASGVTSAASIARLSGRQAAASDPGVAVTVLPNAPTVPPMAPSQPPIAPTAPVYSQPQAYPQPPIYQPPPGVGPIVPLHKPSSKLGLWIGLGVAAAVGITAIVLATGGEDTTSIVEKTEPKQPGPGKLEGKGSAAPTVATAVDRDAALAFLTQAFTQQREQEAKKAGKPPPGPPSRDEVLAFLDTVYAQQRAQQNAQAEHEIDPDAIFAVDISAAVRAGQVDGPAGAPVTIVDVFDFACPYCRKTDTLLDELTAEYAGKVRIVHMGFIVHRDVTHVHRYGCAAAKQNKFGAFKRAFWSKGFDVYAATGGKDRASLSEDAILRWAPSIGLDPSKLRADATGADCTQRVDEDIAELGKFKISATPTYFINGKVVSGGMPKEQFKQRIDERLAVAEQSGVGGADYYRQEVAGKGLGQFRAKPGAVKPVPTGQALREEALKFLDEAYARSQKDQRDRQANELDPDGVFAVDIRAAIAAGQLEGPRNAPVTIVEAFDFACPYCSRSHPILEELLADYAGKVRVVYLNLVVHPPVQLAHQYGCAAAKQGKFVAYKNAFWKQGYEPYQSSGGKDARSLEEANILVIAGGLGLDRTKLKSDAYSDECKARVAADATELQKFKVTGTPAFFINGKFIGGAIPKDKFKQIIDDKLRTATADYYDQSIMVSGDKAFRAKP